MQSACMPSYLTIQPFWSLIVWSLGCLVFLNSFLSFLNWFYKSFLRPTKNLKHYGSWTLITGATDGIGKAFAHQLAQKGQNLILVGRNFTKLTTTSNEIKEKCPETKIKTLTLDFSSSISTCGLNLIEEAINGVEVGVLINNMGITYPEAMFFHEVDRETWMNIIRVNLEATTWVTRVVIPGMVARRRGAIVNIGSGAATVMPSHPLYTIYAATKAYIDQLSRCLDVEYKQFGIDVQCQVPLYVATKMTKQVASIEKASLFIPSPEDYVRAAIGRIGYETRCTPYWTHSLQWAFSRFVPHSLLDSWRLSIGLQRRNKARQFGPTNPFDILQSSGE